MSEKLPLVAGFTTWSPSSVETTIVDPGTVLPLTGMTFFVKTSSSFCDSTARKRALSGVGDAVIFELIVTGFDFSEGIVLVS